MHRSMFASFAAGLTALVGLSLSAAPAEAATVSLAIAPPGIVESVLDDCIFGNPSLGCPSAYQLPSGSPGLSVTNLTHEFTVAEIRAKVGNVFSVGVDANIATGRPEIQTLTKFTLSLVGGGLLYELDQPSYTINAEVANGNGKTDYIISLYNLAGLLDTDRVVFTISLEGLTDGAEQFFFLDAPEVPIPGALWLMGAGLAGLGFAGRRKKKA